VTGETHSDNFPRVKALQPHIGSLGLGDAFVAKLNRRGSALLYATYLGGSFGEIGHSIAVDPHGNAYVTGFTDSTDFPLQHALQAELGGGAIPPGGAGDAFVTKLTHDGAAFVYSTYLGGSDSEVGLGIAVGPQENVYVTGFTQSTDFPTAQPLQPHSGGGLDGFVARLNAAGSALVYSTYLGGSDSDDAMGIAVDHNGNAYVKARRQSGCLCGQTTA
jgi:hypothetical protein